MSDGFRLHGPAPYGVVVLHGGPGAIGSAYELAHFLSEKSGVLEPFQTRSSIAGLLDELQETILAKAAPPVILVGHSWGAWLAGLFAARHPDLVQKVVLVGCGPMEEMYVPLITETRMKRMAEEDREFYKAIIKGEFPGGREEALKRLGKIASKTDGFEPLPEEQTPDPVPFRADLYEAIWKEASEMRKSERLLDEFARVECPIIALHGDWDPHPASGVEEPLNRVACDFEFHLLKECGHEPWRERRARETVLKIFG